MRFAVTLAALLALSGTVGVSGQMPDVAEPFKVGTFAFSGGPGVGIVYRDVLIAELNAANAALETDPAYPSVPMPEDLIELIGRYEYGLKYRLYEITNYLVENGRLQGSGRADFVHDVDDIHILPPLQYPGKILNAAVNFYTHVSESAGPEERAAAQRQRREDRGVPYLFLKPARGAVITTGDPIVIPYGRDRTDWEVELGAVIGTTAQYVTAAEAQGHVFGYIVSIDVSDRGGRPPGGYGQGQDWFVGKGHQTFAPQGPWIAPKEFFGNPMENFRQTLSVGGQMLQDSGPGDMIHSLWELIEYASSIIALYPGDVINNGTSGGTLGGSTDVRGDSGYLRPGEVIEATIDGIGTLRHTAVAGERPAGDMGVRLPPVSSYRDN